MSTLIRAIPWLLKRLEHSRLFNHAFIILYFQDWILPLNNLVLIIIRQEDIIHSYLNYCYFKDIIVEKKKKKRIHTRLVQHRWMLTVDKSGHKSEWSVSRVSSPIYSFFLHVAGNNFCTDNVKKTKFEVIFFLMPLLVCLSMQALSLGQLSFLLLSECKNSCKMPLNHFLTICK